MKKKKVGLVIVCILVFGFSNIFAQNYPPPISLNVPQIRQQTQTWCWLAVVEMVSRYYNRRNVPAQCQVMASAFQIDCCRSSHMCNRAGSLREMRYAIMSFAGKDITWHPPNINPMEINKFLRENKLIIVQIRTREPNLHHVLVIRGMRFGPVTVQTSSGPRTRIEPLLLLNDPSYTYSGEVPYGVLTSVWNRSMVVDRDAPGG